MTIESAPEAPVLAISGLSVSFPKRYGSVSVLDGVNLEIQRGESVAIVGESGCGKSLLGLAASALLPPTAEIRGTVEFKGRDIHTLSAREMRAVRGSGIGIVYQDALTSLNPGMSVGAQLRQVCNLGGHSVPESLLDDVGLPTSSRILRAKPYQLSGGQRQRVLIAMALARAPELIIADEPTTALDVTVQAQILQLLKNLQLEHRFALMFISHDLALVSQVAARTAVMYAGQIVEVGSTAEVLLRSRHPYTTGLMAASVSLDEGHETLSSIGGLVGQPRDFADGCRFQGRCPNATARCSTRPTLTVSDYVDHEFACFHPVRRNEGPQCQGVAVGDSR